MTMSGPRVDPIPSSDADYRCGQCSAPNPTHSIDMGGVSVALCKMCLQELWDALDDAVLGATPSEDQP